MRIVPGANSVADADDCLDPKQDLWLQDHCPTWTVPALAMMSIVARLAAGAQARAPGRPVVGFRNIRMMRWLSFADGARAIKYMGYPVVKTALRCVCSSGKKKHAATNLSRPARSFLVKAMALGLVRGLLSKLPWHRTLTKPEPYSTDHPTKRCANFVSVTKGPPLGSMPTQDTYRWEC